MNLLIGALGIVGSIAAAQAEYYDESAESRVAASRELAARNRRQHLARRREMFEALMILRASRCQSRQGD